MPKADSYLKSLFVGRIGAFVLSIAAAVMAFYGVADDLSAQLQDQLIGLGASLAALLAAVSKLREGK